MKQINKKVQQLLSHQDGINKMFKPLFYRMNNEDEKEQLDELLSKDGIIVADNILEQLKDLVKYKAPSTKFSNEELEVYARKHIGEIPIEEYGVWVYYPWSKRLVHILDQAEFVDLRTSRNQYKITREERKILSEKKIGVIGLSVGQSVSLTLAMERSFGELRLADFDVLELTNLNRIRTGVHNLGVPKVYVVAREIAEIDPYLNVKCFAQGITEDNMDEFFTRGGKLDLLIEESDGFDIKILSRYKAKELGVPVLMEASDRCMVDVERFDLEPGRSILHGLLNHLDIQTLKNLKTNEEKIPYMLDILGIDTSSLRLRASMLEIEQSINTWPQLGSAVIMGGGITADVSRRILLNQFTESGRYYIDIEELVGNKTKPGKVTAAIYEYPELTENEMIKIAATVNLPHAGEEQVGEEAVIQWVSDAIKAPSAGNNQPWKWLWQGQGLFLFHDKQKSISWSDPFDHLAHVGIGAALQNLILSAQSNGYACNINYFPAGNDALLIAAITFAKATELISPLHNKLYDAVNIRCTNRKKGDGQLIDKKILQNIASAIDHDAEILFAEKRDDINELAEIVSTVEKLRFLHPEGHYEFFKKEIRWTENEVQQTKDGLDVATLELSFTDQTGLRVASNPEVMAKLREWKGGNGLQKITRDAIKSSAAVGLLRMKGNNADVFLKGGLQLQRAWLCANHYSISFHPIASPIFFFERVEKLKDLPSDMDKVLREQQNKFEKIFTPRKNTSNIFLFRLSHSGPASKHSLRRDLQESLVIRHLQNV